MAERDIIFRIGEQEFGFDVFFVTAIESAPKIVAVPNSPHCILGLMNLRGEVIPVYGLRRRFEMEDAAPDGSAKLIVTRYGRKPLAFLVDEVLEMRDFEEEQLTPPPVITKSDRTDFIRAVANKDGRLVLLLDPASMYEGDEEAQMDQLIAEMK